MAELFAQASTAPAFTVTALGSVLVSLAVRNAFPVDIASLHQKISVRSFWASAASWWRPGRAAGVGTVLAPFISFG